jgi:site-specific DNA recombinase
MKMDKKTALLYIRVSTARQANTGHSVDSQEALLTERAELDGYQVEVITETGSGRNTARPELIRALDKLAKGQAHALYSLDTDRLARSTMHLLEIVQLSIKQDWRLVITTADVDTSTPAGKVFLTMVAAFAQFESDMIALRIKRQHQARRDRGIVWGRDAGNLSKVSKETRELIETLRADGMSLNKIAEHMIANGHKTARGGLWHGPAVAQILKSPMSNMSNRNS